MGLGIVIATDLASGVGTSDNSLHTPQVHADTNRDPITGQAVEKGQRPPITDQRGTQAELLAAQGSIGAISNEELQKAEFNKVATPSARELIYNVVWVPEGNASKIAPDNKSAKDTIHDAIWGQGGGDANSAAGQTAANGTPNNLNPLATPTEEAAALKLQIAPLLTSMPVGPQTTEVSENITAALSNGSLERLREILPAMATWQKAPIAGGEDMNSLLASEMHPHIGADAGVAQHINDFRAQKAAESMSLHGLGAAG